ncbi:MAG TPA: ABC transporter permease [Steroidobacteraceae bacterium]|nr:ABC transporter permease [Steroidobacteraceae bacterium]
MALPAQILAVTAANVRSIPRRLGNSLVIVVGVAGVVAVLILVLTMFVGFRTTIRGDGRADRAIILPRGAATEYEGSLSRETAAAVMNAPGIRHDGRGQPVVSAEVILVAPVARKGDNSDVNVTLRGVGGQYFLMRPELRLVSGRMFRPGNQELLAGASASAQFAGLDIGKQVRLQDGDWTVVGIFAGANGARESELVADALTVMSAYKLDAFSTMGVMLESPGAIASLRDALARDPTLQVDVRGEPEYLATASDGVNRMLRLVAYAIGSIMALGALFAALNSMSSAVAARSVEIATLRAIGFGPSAVAVSVLIEALLLALLGAALGVGVAYAAFNGTTISTLGGAVWDSQLVYSLTITRSVTAAAVLLACALGLLGGVVPAIRAVRSKVADALHES